MCEEHPDVVILASSILSLEMVVAQLPVTRLRRSTLFVDVCSVKEFPKRLMLSLLPPEVRPSLCTCASSLAMLPVLPYKRSLGCKWISGNLETLGS